MLFKCIFILLFVPQFVFAGTPILLEWSGVKDGVYKIQVSKNKKFTKLIVNKKIEQPFYRFKKAFSGLFYWRVKVRTKKVKKWLYTSEYGVIDLKLTSIDPIGPKDKKFYSATAKSHFSWQKNKRFSNYDLVIERLDNKKLIKRTISNKNKYHLNLPPGDYRWFLIQKDDKGEIVQKTRPKKFSFIRKKKKTKLIAKKPEKIKLPARINFNVTEPNEKLYSPGPKQNKYVLFSWDNKNAKKLRLNSNEEEKIFDVDKNEVTILLEKSRRYEWNLINKKNNKGKIHSVKVDTNLFFDFMCFNSFGKASSSQENLTGKLVSVSDFDYDVTRIGCTYQHYFNYGNIYSIDLGGGIENGFIENASTSDIELQDYQSLFAYGYVNYQMDDLIFINTSKRLVIDYATGIEAYEFPFFEYEGSQITTLKEMTYYLSQKVRFNYYHLPHNFWQSIHLKAGYELSQFDSWMLDMGYYFNFDIQESLLKYFSWTVGAEYNYTVNLGNDGKYEHTLSKLQLVGAGTWFF